MADAEKQKPEARSSRVRFFLISLMVLALVSVCICLVIFERDTFTPFKFNNVIVVDYPDDEGTESSRFFKDPSNNIHIQIKSFGSNANYALKTPHDADSQFQMKEKDVEQGSGVSKAHNSDTFEVMYNMPPSIVHKDQIDQVGILLQMLMNQPKQQFDKMDLGPFVPDTETMDTVFVLSPNVRGNGLFSTKVHTVPQATDYSELPRPFGFPFRQPFNVMESLMREQRGPDGRAQPMKRLESFDELMAAVERDGDIGERLSLFPAEQRIIVDNEAEKPFAAFPGQAATQLGDIEELMAAVERDGNFGERLSLFPAEQRIIVDVEAEKPIAALPGQAATQLGDVEKLTAAVERDQELPGQVSLIPEEKQAIKVVDMESKEADKPTYIQDINYKTSSESYSDSSEELSVGTDSSTAQNVIEISSMPSSLEINDHTEENVSSSLPTENAGAEELNTNTPEIVSTPKETKTEMKYGLNEALQMFQAAKNMFPGIHAKFNNDAPNSRVNIALSGTGPAPPVSMLQPENWNSLLKEFMKNMG